MRSISTSWMIFVPVERPKVNRTVGRQSDKLIIAEAYSPSGAGEVLWLCPHTWEPALHSYGETCYNTMRDHEDSTRLHGGPGNEAYTASGELALTAGGNVVHVTALLDMIAFRDKYPVRECHSLNVPHG